MKLDDLLDYSHILHVEEGEQWKPVEIDLSMFNDVFEEVKGAIDEIMSYLSLPYIIDDFKNHGLRSQWRSGFIKEEFSEFVNQTSWRTNRVWGSFSSVLYLDSIYEGMRKPEFTVLCSELGVYLMPAYENNSGDYTTVLDNMEPMDKLKFVKEYKKRCYLVLQFLEEVR